LVFSKNSNSSRKEETKRVYKLSPETRRLQSGLKTKNANFTGSMLIVDEQDIINTYSEDEQFSCKKYAEYKELIKENPSFGYKRCAKLLGVSQGRTRWWHTKGEKRAVPLALKAVEKLKKAGLIPFTQGHKHAGTIFNILGTLFGDGGIDIMLNTTAFISADKRDVDLWKKDLIEVFPFAKNKMNVVEGGEWGHSYNMRTFDRAVIRFFVALGAPVGDKVATKYALPKYIFKLSWNRKIAFLDGLLSSEISVPNFRGDNRWNWTKRFTNFSLGLSKIDVLEEKHRQFLEDLKKLCASVRLSCTPNLRKEIGKITQRKDGHKSCCYRIFFQTHFEKVIKFNKRFQLRYAAGKKKRLNAEVEKALAFRNWRTSPASGRFR